jgi:hypothetical protein
MLATRYIVEPRLVRNHLAKGNFDALGAHLKDSSVPHCFQPVFRLEALNSTQHPPPWPPVAGSPSCHPCCTERVEEERGCGDLPWTEHVQSCRGSRRTRSIGASGTSSGRCIRGKRRHRRYHLCNLSVFCAATMFATHRKWRAAAPRTNGCGLDHVPDREPLDRLVLGRASRAVGAADRLDVAAALLVATAARECQFRGDLGAWRRVAYLDARFLTMLG